MSGRTALFLEVYTVLANSKPQLVNHEKWIFVKCALTRLKQAMSLGFGLVTFDRPHPPFIKRAQVS